jgi:hypothetical protein
MRGVEIRRGVIELRASASILVNALGITKAFVPAGVRPPVRSTIVTPTMLRKARLEAEEGRALSPTEVKRIRGAKKYTNSYLKQKLRFDPRLGDPSLFHPASGTGTRIFNRIGYGTTAGFCGGAGQDRVLRRPD